MGSVKNERAPRSALSRPTNDRTSILIPSWGRTEQLRRCLESLERQTKKPDEVIVVWQADDTPTNKLVQDIRPTVSFSLKSVHSAEKGVVPAENRALEEASGELIVLLDDDAVAPPGWLERLHRLFDDPKVGAAGGPMNNFQPDGTPFPKRRPKAIGLVSWTGKFHGNTYDLAPDAYSDEVIKAHHLVGANMCLRRRAFERFESAMRCYWQMFEADACLQVLKNGYDVLFDCGNPIDHYPTNTVFIGNREGDLEAKIFNPAYNQSLLFAKHSSSFLRPVRLARMLFVGSVGMPGLAGSLVATLRFGNPTLELRILRKTWESRLAGWKTGRCAANVSRTITRQTAAPTPITEQNG
jgi:GT2 family glycosyltransferase